MSGALLAVVLVACGAASAQPAGQVTLHQGWRLASSCKVPGSGEQISLAGFAAEAWTPTTVPATVLAAQVAAGQFPEQNNDPYFGTNLRQFPGTSYPIPQLYVNHPIAPDSPYRCSWWYRTEFPSPAGWQSKTTWLHFEGINYRANIWLNGKRVAESQQVAGAYRTYDFDISSQLVAGTNALAVEVFTQTENDLGINFVDWNPTPPDRSMGLWRPVYLRTTGPVTVSHPAVSTHFADATLEEADLAVSVNVKNASTQLVEGVLTAQLGGVGPGGSKVHLTKKLTLAPGEMRSVDFTPADYPALHVKHPAVWWPYRLGAQPLHPIHATFTTAHGVTDSVTGHFGIREVTSRLTPKGARLFQVNQRNFLIRGGGWAPDMLLRENSPRLQAELQYVRHLGLNTIRLEGKLENDEFFDTADRMGILVMAGWCCCDHWEHWNKWTADDHKIAQASLASQIQRLRTHPSVIAWLNGSDGPPPADVEREYLAVLQENRWPNPVISSAAANATTVSGESGVKMTGPYDYVPPSYWLRDPGTWGGAWRFNTETSPGPAIPVEESLRKFLPERDLWPRADNATWNYHAGLSRFTQTTIYDRALVAMYGAPKDLADYERKSQAMAYDAERGMFEAYGRNKYEATGVVQWMLNNAWPSIIWHLYDYYLQPAGGYFGTRKALEPVHVQYSYDDGSVAVVNSTAEAATGAKVSARLYDLRGHQTWAKDAVRNIAPDGVVRAFTLPPVSGSDPVFVRLSLADAAGRAVSNNFYWLPPQPTEFDWAKSDGMSTPARRAEDLTALQALPPATVQSKSSIKVAGGRAEVKVTLRNAGPEVAFLIRNEVRARCGDQALHEVLPVFWDDNYVSLLPGETRTLTAALDWADAADPARMNAGGAALHRPASTCQFVAVTSGWNVAEQQNRLAPSRPPAR